MHYHEGCFGVNLLNDYNLCAQSFTPFEVLDFSIFGQLMF